MHTRASGCHPTSLPHTARPCRSNDPCASFPLLQCELQGQVSCSLRYFKHKDMQVDSRCLINICGMTEES